MVSRWEKIKVYAKLSFICLVILAALIFIGSNNQPVTVSFFGWRIVTVGAWLLIVLAGLAGVVMFLIVNRAIPVLRDFKRLRKESRAAKTNTHNAD